MTSASDQRPNSGYVERRAPYGRRRVDAVVAALGLSALVGSASVARSGRVGGVELSIFRTINELPDVLSPAMQAAQYLGVLGVGPLAAATALLFRRPRLALAALLVTGEKLVAERIVWEYVSRSRPGTTIVDAIVRGSTPATGAAFVSGHVVLVVALATVSTPYLHGWVRAVPWGTTALVAFARIYLGAHAPLDVVGGAGLGLALGGATNLALGVPTDGD